MGNVPVKAYNPYRKKNASKRGRGKQKQDTLSVSVSSRKSGSSSGTEVPPRSDSSRGYPRPKPGFEKFRQNQPIPENAPPAIKIVREYLYSKDAQRIEGMERLTDENCVFDFVDAEAEMRACDFHQAMEDTFASFPNIHFFWKYMRITGIDPKTQSTIVEVGDYFGVGKHEGKPYAFGPYEAIPATGITIRDEKILFTFFVRDGKILKATVDAFGDIVGPPGFYTKIGGVIPHLYWYEPSSS